MRRSWVVVMWVLVLVVLGSVPAAKACNGPESGGDAARVEAVMACGDLLFDAYLLDPRPDAVVREEWKPAWTMWARLEERRKGYEAATIWNEVVEEDEALVAAYCDFEEVSPVDLATVMPGAADEINHLATLCKAMEGRSR